MKGSIPAMVASTRAKVADFAGASRLLNKLGSPDRVTVLLDIAKAQAKAGMKSEASSTLEQALRSATTIRDAMRKREALAAIAAAQVQAGVGGARQHP